MTCPQIARHTEVPDSRTIVQRSDIKPSYDCHLCIKHATVRFIFIFLFYYQDRIVALRQKTNNYAERADFITQITLCTYIRLLATYFNEYIRNFIQNKIFGFRNFDIRK